MGSTPNMPSEHSPVRGCAKRTNWRKPVNWIFILLVLTSASSCAERLEVLSVQPETERSTTEDTLLVLTSASSYAERFEIFSVQLETQRSTFEDRRLAKSTAEQWNR